MTKGAFEQALSRRLSIGETFEDRYAYLVRDVMANGQLRESRNHPTKSVFGRMLVVEELTQGFFPLLYGRKLFPGGVLGELAAFLQGPKKLSDFEYFGCNYWKQWANEDGTINVDYGNKWLDFNGVNQIKNVIENLVNAPTSRRHLVSGWDPATAFQTNLPCCHLLYQWYVAPNNKIDMIFYMRSVDVMIGLPSDVILAAAMNILMAASTGYDPGKLIFMLGDTHIYESHFEGVSRYLSNVDMIGDERRLSPYNLSSNASIEDFKPDDITLPYYSVLNLPVIKFDLHS
jgi:thymidylate synthase